MEAFPIVESLAQRFDLIMFDPQAGDQVRFRTGAELFETWSQSNVNAVEYLSKEGSNVNYLSRERADSFWSYMTNYRSLMNELASDNVFVPRQVLIIPGNSTQVGTAIVWTRGIHLVVPETVWIFVVYPKNLWRRDNKVVFFSSETVLTPLRHYLRDYDAD